EQRLLERRLALGPARGPRKRCRVARLDAVAHVVRSDAGAQARKLGAGARGAPQSDGIGPCERGLGVADGLLARGGLLIAHEALQAGIARFLRQLDGLDAQVGAAEEGGRAGRRGRLAIDSLPRVTLLVDEGLRVELLVEDANPAARDGAVRLGVDVFLER